MNSSRTKSVLAIYCNDLTAVASPFLKGEGLG